MTSDPDPETAERGDSMQVGVVAERLGLSIRTLHHWDAVGLVTPSARSAGGFRLYTEADVERLVLIRRMKPLGFSLEEMKELLEAVLTLSDPAATDEARTAADRTIGDCRVRVAERRREFERLITWTDEFDALLTSNTPPAAWSV